MCIGVGTHGQAGACRRALLGRVYDSGCWCAEVGRPDWSPDGAWIAFGMNDADTDAEPGTFLIRPDGSEIQRISEVPLVPAWQPIPRDSARHSALRESGDIPSGATLLAEHVGEACGSASSLMDPSGTRVVPSALHVAAYWGRTGAYSARGCIGDRRAGDAVSRIGRGGRRHSHLQCMREGASTGRRMADTCAGWIRAGPDQHAATAGIR